MGPCGIVGAAVVPPVAVVVMPGTPVVMVVGIAGRGGTVLLVVGGALGIMGVGAGTVEEVKVLVVLVGTIVVLMPVVAPVVATVDGGSIMEADAAGA